MNTKTSHPVRCRWTPDPLLYAGGSRLWRRLVPRGTAKQRNHALYPEPEIPQLTRQIQQCKIQTPPPRRDHVRQVQGLEARHTLL